jgi:hypothetical protein
MAAGLAVAALFVAHALLYPRAFEDSYILYRYADNVFAGHGFVFNPGEPVEGYTSWLYVVVLTALRLFTDDLAAAAPWLSIAFGAVTVLCAMAIARRLAPGRTDLGVLAGLLCAAHASLAKYAATGMETTLLALLASLSFLAATRPPAPEPTKTDGVALGALFGLMATARPEGALYAAILLLAAWHHRGLPTAIRAGATFGAIAATFLAWRLATYGYPAPNTYYAKLADEPAAFIWAGVAYAEGFLLLHLGALGVLGLAVATARRIAPAVTALALTTAAIAAAVAQHGDIFPLHRFLVAVVPFVAAGTAWLAAAATQKLHAPWNRVAPTTAAVAIAAWLVVAPRYPAPVLLGMDMGMGTDAQEIARAAQVTQGYEKIAAWLERQLPETTVLAINAAGVIPYRTGFTTIDMLGLTDEHIAHQPFVPSKYSARGHLKHDGAYVLARDPDVIFIGLPPLFDHPPTQPELQRTFQATLLPGDDTLLRTPAFHERYQVVVTQVTATEYTAFFLRKDRLPWLDPRRAPEPQEPFAGWTNASLGGASLVVGPHPQNLDHFVVFNHLVHEAVLDVDATRVGPREVAQQLLVAGRILKWVLPQNLQQGLCPRLQPDLGELLRVLLGMLREDQSPAHQSKSSDISSWGVDIPSRMDSIIPGTMARCNISWIALQSSSLTSTALWRLPVMTTGWWSEATSSSRPNNLRRASLAVMVDIGTSRQQSTGSGTL